MILYEHLFDIATKKQPAFTPTAYGKVFYIEDKIHRNFNSKKLLFYFIYNYELLQIKSPTWESLHIMN